MAPGKTGTFNIETKHTDHRLKQPSWEKSIYKKQQLLLSLTNHSSEQLEATGVNFTSAISQVSCTVSHSCADPILPDTFFHPPQHPLRT